MTASLTQSQSVSTCADAANATGNSEKCAFFPLMFLFCTAAIWLLASSILALIASLKLHSPNLFADCAWLTYGRVYPAHLNALIYGFAIPAGLGTCLWLFSRIGQTRIMLPGLAAGGALIWNFGVLIGVTGILHGGSTGFDWLEIPRYASPILFLGYALIGISALVTSAHRRVWELSVAQWFFIAAIFWFPWIYSTANLLLVFSPVRGVVQAIINWWFINNLTVWFAIVGLGIIFHFVPVAVGRPVYNRPLALFSFWLFLFIAPWAGIPTGAPVPSWIPACSTVASVLLIVPVIAIVMNIGKTIGGDCEKMKQTVGIRFIKFAFPCLVISIFLNAATSIPQVGAIVNFTWLNPAVTRLVLFGFFAMTIFGAIYEIIPRFIPGDFMCPKAARLQLISGSLGILIWFVSLAVGGVAEGLGLANARIPFAQVLQKTLMFLRVSTLGDLLILVSTACFVANLLRVCVGCCRACCSKKSEAA